MTDQPNKRVCWIPQIPGEAFIVDVATYGEALGVMCMLANYDQFQLDQNIKPDYANMGWVEAFEDGEWVSLDDDEVQELAEAEWSALPTQPPSRFADADGTWERTGYGGDSTHQTYQYRLVTR